MNELTVEDPQDSAAANNPRPSRKGVCRLPHPTKQGTPRLLLQGEEKEDVAYVHAFVGRAVALWQQVGAQLDEHRGLADRLGPNIILDMERVQIDRAGEGCIR